MCEIRVKEFSFLSSNKYTEIHGKMWIPDRDVEAVLQISHGMAEHIDRYDEFARYLAARGLLVVGNNHMGHGNSIVNKDDLGYFAIPIKGMNKRKAENYSSSADLVKDLVHITKTVKKHYPGVPYILLGHSMGSFIARRYLMEYGNELDGIIIMGTGNQPGVVVNVGLAITKMLIMTKGDRFRSELIYKMMFGAYNRKIDNPVSGDDWICTNKETLKKYEEDELCGFKFTLNGYEALLSTIKYIINKENIKKIPKDVKMLINAGKEDPVGDYGEAVKQVYETYTAQGVKDITLTLYDGCRHEILNETNKDKVYKDIYMWINDHVIHKIVE